MYRKSEVLNKTKASKLPIHSFGEPFGKYEKIFNEEGIFSGNEFSVNNDSWYDLMTDEKGNFYAVFINGNIDCLETDVFYYEVGIEPVDYQRDVLLNAIKRNRDSLYGRISTMIQSVKV